MNLKNSKKKLKTKPKISNSFNTSSHSYSKDSVKLFKNEIQDVPDIEPNIIKPEIKPLGLIEIIQLGVARVGNSVERAGKSIQSNGYHRIGRAIEKLGNRVEHLKN